jgi:hypothetical protein
MFLNRMAQDGYSYTVVYHVRDLIKAGPAEAVDQEVIERNSARKTVIPGNRGARQARAPGRNVWQVAARPQGRPRPGNLSDDRMLLRLAPE